MNEKFHRGLPSSGRLRVKILPTMLIGGRRDVVTQKVHLAACAQADATSRAKCSEIREGIKAGYSELWIHARIIELWPTLEKRK